MRRIRSYLDELLKGGYFYNREWVRLGKRSDDICMEFEHFMTRRKRYLWVRWISRDRKGFCGMQCFFGRKRRRRAVVYLSEKPPHSEAFHAVTEEEVPYLHGLFLNRGISSAVGCWQRISHEAFSFDECKENCCFSLYREVEDARRTDSETTKYWAGEFIYDDSFAEEKAYDSSCEFKYLYVVQIITKIKSVDQVSPMRAFIKYMQSPGPAFYIMRTATPQEQLKLKDGMFLKINSEKNGRMGYVAEKEL